ncbi:hypothetical protein IT6_09570 [Methylacidiphilum caldifontis]|uniref:hypothetical protein n=1 Tax=Methylacidiphilum caldifontis TaxID=2795386 RepID=UPI001A8DCE84|nr:hypothetical protein [Methylacidiphilum caldifontis]QSR88598.1 hypothetical protein IT6_09570 [Methylacidiphilum caldifontis]
MKRNTHKILRSPVYRLIVSGIIVGMPLMGPAIFPFSITRVWAETLATQSIGMVQGTGTITQNHLDIPLSGGKFPLANGAKITTEAGVIRVLFPGRNWVQLGPYGSMMITKNQTGYVVKIEGGEVKFHLNEGSNVSFEAPTSRFLSTDQAINDGSILVTSSDIISVSMKKGEVRVEDLANKKEFLANSGNPVVLGANSLEIIPTSSDEIVAEGSSELPSGAVPLYGADGHCVGYMTKNGGFVSAPGIVPPLSHPINQVSLSKVPKLPQGAKPLFDKHGKYMGYADKGLFVYDDPPDDNNDKRKRRRAAAIILGTLAAGVVGFTAAGISGAFTSHPGAPVTPVTPFHP